MYRSHREAFTQKKGTKKPVESNLDNIINQAQIKMKEMIQEKQETDKKTNLLIGQENVLNEKLNETKEEIKKFEIENKKVIKEANIQEAKLKDDINGINYKLDKIKNGTIPAEASKTFELKKGCEEVSDLKNENNKLREKLYLLSRRLYSLEVRKYIFNKIKIFLY